MDAPIVEFDDAHFCQDCKAVAKPFRGACVRCGSASLIGFAKVLDRPGEEENQGSGERKSG